MENWVDNVGVNKHKRKEAKEVQALDVDLTPMLDVVMILLIFFIVTASFVREQSIEFELTRTSKALAEKSDVRNIIFQVSATNAIWIKGRRIDIRSVRSNISQMHGENPEAGVIIKAHNLSTIKTVAAIVDASRKEGIYNVSLASGKSVDGP